MKMPSASVKPVESIGSLENKDPLYKVSLLMEKKIRNLEKRKNKLEHYKEELDQGKTLNEDQQHAIKAFDTVLASLDLCREFSTQISEVMTENVNLQKIQLKKQQEDKAHHEYERIKQVLKVQDALNRMRQDDVRADFLSGNNGAFRVSEEKISHLDELFKLITPNTDEKFRVNSTAFKGQLNSCAENILTLLDGKNKPAGKSTYREMKTLVYQIANCSYPKSSSKGKENSSSHSSTPDSDPQSNRKKSKKKQDLEIGVSEPLEQSQTSSPIEPEQPRKESAVTRDSSVCSNSTNGMSITEKINEPPSLLDGPPPPGMVPHNIPAAPVVTPVASAASTSDLRTPLVHMSPPSLNPSAPSQVAPPPIVLPPQAYYNQSSSMPPPSQPISQFSMDINDLVTSSRFNFLQESHVSQIPEQSSVYMDPAVVSFGSIKPESLIHLHEQQPPQPPQQSHMKLSHPQPLNPVVGLSSTVDPHPATISTETFVNKNIVLGSGSTNEYTPSPLYQQNKSDLGKVSTTISSTEISSTTQAREKTPPRQSSKIETTSWAEQASRLSPSNQNDFEDGWSDPINGTADDKNENRWIDEPEEKLHFASEFSADPDRKNFRSNRGNMRPGGVPRGMGSNGGYRGRGGGYGYQGGNRSNPNAGGNSFRSNRGGPPGIGFRGRGSGRGNGMSNNRNFRGNRGGNSSSFQNSRGQF